MSEIEDLFTKFSDSKDHKCITGDFNIHVDDSTDSLASRFKTILDCHSLKHHTLDLILVPAEDNVFISAFPSHHFSDHLPVLSEFNISAPVRPCENGNTTFRKISAIDLDSFCDNLIKLPIVSSPPDSLSELVDCYNNSLTQLLNAHAPLISKPIKPNHKPWFTPNLHNLRKICRMAERTFRKFKSTANEKKYTESLKAYHKAIEQAKQEYLSNLVSKTSHSSKTLWQTVNKLLHRNTPKKLPAAVPSQSLPGRFLNFFTDKITTLRQKLSSHNQHHALHSEQPASPQVTPPRFSNFRPADIETITSLILSSPDKQCELDPIPTCLLKKCCHILAPSITKIVNLSLTTGSFPSSFKHAIVTPLIKKPNLDAESLSNYRPISNLPFLSKLVERVVKSQITTHLESHHLNNPFQSAYSRNHSTESALLFIHDSLINSMAASKITGLCLLDLSAAFDTIDHSILLERLSSLIGVEGTALSWFSSYLLSRSFSVRTNEHLSDPHTVATGVPQGSILGPILFNIYTTPLSSLITSHNTEHHFYADDTQIFMSFSPASCHDNLRHLSETISSISKWMNLNFLSLNQSKTEFLLIGHSKQLSKCSNSLLDLGQGIAIQPVDHAKNLGFVFDKHLTLHDHITSVIKACNFHLRDLRRLRPTIDFRTAHTIATSLVHSKLDYCNSLFLNLPQCELNRLQLVQNALARAITRTPKYSHISPVLKSLHWLKIQERIKFKVCSLTFKALQSSTPQYLRKMLSVQPVRSTRSSSSVTLSRKVAPHKAKILDRSFSFFAPQLWNSLPASLRHPATPNATPHASLLAISNTQFSSKLKTFFFQQSFPDRVPTNSRPPQPSAVLP